MHTGTGQRARRGVAAATIGVLICVVAGPSPAAESSDLPLAAGRTAISWSGIKGITVELPADVTVGTGDLTLRVGQGVFGFAAIRANRYDSLPDPFGCDFCTLNRVWWNEGIGTTSSSGCTPACSYQAGSLEIYLVSDGEAEVVIDFSGLTGETSLRATGEVEGGLERIPVLACDASPFTADCSEYGRGHLVIDVGDDRPVLAMVHGYQNLQHLGSYGGSEIHHELSGRAVSCVYPGTLWPNESPDPQSHPWGCDNGSPADFFSAGGLASVTSSNPRAQNQQYFGFAARVGHQDLNVQRPGLTGYKGTYGALAWWIKRGIACPSGDFGACFGPEEPPPSPVQRYPWGIPRSEVDRPDEASGPQIHPVYLLSWTAPDEQLDMTGVIEDSIRAQNAWFRAQSGGLQWRLDTFTFEGKDPSDPSAEPVEVEAVDVTFVRHPKGPYSIPDVLAANGLNDPDKRYLVYAAARVSGDCGLSDYDATKPIEGVDGRNAIVLLDSPSECRARDFAPGPTQPSFTESIAQHVLVASEGLVPVVAPHHCGGLVWTGHVCTGPLIATPESDPESTDLMFPFAGLLPLGDQVLDRGHDDYFGHPFPYVDLQDSRYLEPAGGLGESWRRDHVGERGLDLRSLIRGAAPPS